MANKTTKVIIDLSLLSTPDFNQDHLWFITKLNQFLGNYHSKHPGVATLQRWTGWGKNKVLKVSDELVAMGLLTKEYRYRASGGNTSNQYEIKTNRVKFITEESYEGYGFSDSDNDVPTVSQNQTPQDIVSTESSHTPNVLPDGVPKSNTAVSQNQTLLTSNNSSLIPPIENSEKKLNSQNQEFEPENIQSQHEPELSLEQKIIQTKKIIKSQPYFESNINKFKRELNINSNDYDDEVLTEVATKIIKNGVLSTTISFSAYLRIGYKKAIENQLARDKHAWNEQNRNKNRVFTPPHYDKDYKHESREFTPTNLTPKNGYTEAQLQKQARIQSQFMERVYSSH